MMGSFAFAFVNVISAAAEQDIFIATAAAAIVIARILLPIGRRFVWHVQDEGWWCWRVRRAMGFRKHILAAAAAAATATARTITTQSEPYGESRW